MILLYHGLDQRGLCLVNHHVIAPRLNLNSRQSALSGVLLLPCLGLGITTNLYWAVVEIQIEIIKRVY